MNDGSGRSAPQLIRNVGVAGLADVTFVGDTPRVPVALMLVLAQVAVFPPAGPARFSSTGFWVPPVMGRVSVACDDGGWAVAWADQRRFPGQSTGFSDVWVAASTSNGFRYLPGSSLSAPNAIRDNALIAANGNGWLLGWSELDAGWLLKARNAGKDITSGWTPERLIADAGWFDHGTDVAAGGFSRG